MIDMIVGYGLTAMMYMTLATMAVVMVILPAVDIVREIVREFRG